MEKKRSHETAKTNSRSCQHNHGKIQTDNEEVTSPPSPINEEDEGYASPDILKVEDRPTTASSGRKSALNSSFSRPPSRRLDNRPSSTRSTFEHIPGTRPASRRKPSSQCGKTHLGVNMCEVGESVSALLERRKSYIVSNRIVINTQRAQFGQQKHTKWENLENLVMFKKDLSQKGSKSASNRERVYNYHHVGNRKYVPDMLPK
ncbi:hypothetical protein MAR_010409 [Mya arenaria]|uniref:Uncharacterized protein n=1 Tax=Mya arenaria TaxID=6604 RepID=A0ABY7E9M9_MYAAR|nr:hypothetical protein MAR_010409 [Mya arenaria]